jgi:hypothetical protein
MSMTTPNEKRTFILEHEEKFADALAVKVIDKPRLSLWMILIPIIFVYYFYQFQRFRTGREAFAENYMISRKRALDESLAVVETGREPDIQRLIRMSTLPEDTHEQYREFLSVLIEHYTELLRSKGEDFESLVRSAYRNRTNFLLFLNRLNQAEKILNTALKTHLSKTAEGIDEVVETIQTYSEKLRRNNAEKIFV